MTKRSLLVRSCLLLLLSLSLPLSHAQEAGQASPQTCSWSSCSSNDPNEIDPNLKEFTYDVGDGPMTTTVYVQPDINTFYQQPEGTFAKVQPKFNGLAGKFINMSNQRLDFYWESYEGGPAHLMRNYAPFSTGGTGTFPTHRFFFSKEGDSDARVHTMVVQNYPESLYVYDPYLVPGDPDQTESNLQANLNEKERSRYDKWVKTLRFNEQYLAFTGRPYLSNYGSKGPRKPPMHHFWRADYFGQEHWVTTRETHFETLPPKDSLGPLEQRPEERILKESDSRPFQEYRTQTEDGQPLQFLNMTLTALSCAPRVFEIRNFLSQREVDHILELAGGITLTESTTGDVGSNKDGSKQVGDRVERKTKVRTSKNSWVGRERSPILDAIYRRAADLTRIDESLLRSRGKNEFPELSTKRSISETLQLVHYDPKQEYTAHHDFGYSHIDDDEQGARFATILFYLNDDMVGGETAFPRYQNGKSFHELKVKPEIGKAILFYDQLPDGNMDDFSQHAAKPVIRGEKWLINLWIWDPVYERS